MTNSSQITLEINNVTLNQGDTIILSGLLESAAWPYCDIPSNTFPCTNSEAAYINVLITRYTDNQWVETIPAIQAFATSGTYNYIKEHIITLGAGSYNVQAHFMGNSEYDESYSPIVVITVESVCVPHWVCIEPKNGYEQDGCGNTRANQNECNPTSQTHRSCVNNVCKTVTGSGSNTCSSVGATCSSPPPGQDQYYDCINGQCTKVSGTSGYKNDSTCGGACAPEPPQSTSDNLLFYVALAGSAVVVGYLALRKKRGG